MLELNIGPDLKEDGAGHLWLSGNRFFEDAWRLVAMLKATKRKFNHIVCVARGGFNVVAIVGNGLSRNDITVITVSSYKGKERRAVEIVRRLWPNELLGNGKGLLFIDDLVDSGETYIALRKQWPEAFFATVYAKKAGAKATDLFVSTIPSEWIEFPWEKSSDEFIPA